ncbi:tol-pal system YbgF family protein [Streptomyces sp. NPDC048462]|uniref:tetratricopeptide repeat protein n=1 Tax=Streptomyces sp. NPDC048462 TaxID=3365555 RepID=UPI00371B0605
MKLFRSRVRHPEPSPVAGAEALYQAGRYAEAEASAFVRSRPRDETDVPTALTVVALSIGAQGRHAEAVAAYDEALPVFGRIFGAGHWETLKLRSDRRTAVGRARQAPGVRGGVCGRCPGRDPWRRP